MSLVENVLPHPPDDGAGQIDHNDLQKIRERPGQHIEHRHKRTVPEHRGKVHVSRSQFDSVDGTAGQRRADKGEQIGCHGQKKHQQYEPFVLIQIHAEAQKHLPFFHPARGEVARIGGDRAALHSKTFIQGSHLPSASRISHGKADNSPSVPRECPCP